MLSLMACRKRKNFNLSKTGMKDLCVPGKDGAVHLILVIIENTHFSVLLNLTPSPSKADSANCMPQSGYLSIKQSWCALLPWFGSSTTLWCVCVSI